MAVIINIPVIVYRNAFWVFNLFVLMFCLCKHDYTRDACVSVDVCLYSCVCMGMYVCIRVYACGCMSVFVCIQYRKNNMIN